MSQEIRIFYYLFVMDIKLIYPVTRYQFIANKMSPLIKKIIELEVAKVILQIFVLIIDLYKVKIKYVNYF